MKNKIWTVILRVMMFILLLTSFSVSGERIVVSDSIREGEYMDRTDIEEVVFSESCGITEIPDYAFLGCTSLKKVKLPSGLKKIGFQAFSECASLVEVNFPETLEDIGSNSFTYCESLDNVSFPDGLKHIGHNAFSFCGSLKDVFLPDNLEEIESYAFSDCNALQKVRLPANDHLLGELLLNCCPELVEIISPSEKVPKFDCDSYLFDPYDVVAYEKCVLKVPGNVIDSYNVSKSWQKFNRIVIAD
ncbi:MAG: leucine-rich repeat domain-containing protein [Muribaculaceae bacterium]|nr:leucine-rich repeat domain-containing protein [Muribaculaceae bacterium]